VIRELATQCAAGQGNMYSSPVGAPKSNSPFGEGPPSGFGAGALGVGEPKPELNPDFLLAAPLRVLEAVDLADENLRVPPRPLFAIAKC
jgi:hypothetical protein